MGCNFGTTYLLVFLFWDVSQNDNLYPSVLNPTSVSIPLRYIFVHPHLGLPSVSLFADMSAFLGFLERQPAFFKIL